MGTMTADRQRKSVVVKRIQFGRTTTVKFLSDVVMVKGTQQPRFSEDEHRALRFDTVEEAVSYVRSQGWPTDGNNWRLHAAVY